MRKKIAIIIPTVAKDYSRLKRDFDHFFKFLPASKIVFIGPRDVKPLVRLDANKYPDYCIEYMDENSLIPFARVNDAMKTKLESEGYEMREDSRPGWYYQQFLKMAYCNKCEDDYYMTWDADTIPMHEIDMFSSEGKPYFDIKPEYNPGYFITIKKMFGFEKYIDESFISEHMVFNKPLMKELIADIESLPFDGEKFYEKIIYAMDFFNLRHGFAEFETYGTWVSNKHPDFYEFRRWSSMRKAGCYFKQEEMAEDDIEWLAQSFDAVSFESYNNLEPDMSELFNTKEFRQGLTAESLYRSILETGRYGEYTNGMIKDDGVLWPV